MSAKSFYRIDGGGAVEHLSVHDDERSGWSLCGAKARVGGWVSILNERLSFDQLPKSGVCKNCIKVARSYMKDEKDQSAWEGRENETL